MNGSLKSGSLAPELFALRSEQRGVDQNARALHPPEYVLNRELQRFVNSLECAIGLKLHHQHGAKRPQDPHPLGHKGARLVQGHAPGRPS